MLAMDFNQYYCGDILLGRDSFQSGILVAKQGEKNWPLAILPVCCLKLPDQKEFRPVNLHALFIIWNIVVVGAGQKFCRAGGAEWAVGVVWG